MIVFMEMHNAQIINAAFGDQQARYESSNCLIECDSISSDHVTVLDRRHPHGTRG